MKSQQDFKSFNKCSSNDNLSTCIECEGSQLDSLEIKMKVTN